MEALSQADLERLVQAIGPTIAGIVQEAIEKAVVRELRHQRRTSAAPNKPMTLSQAADYLNMSAKTLNQLVLDGKVVFSLVGKRRRFLQKDLDKLMVRPFARIGG